MILAVHQKHATIMLCRFAITIMKHTPINMKTLSFDQT